jgi:ferredoxin-type protein NapH
MIRLKERKIMKKSTITIIRLLFLGLFFGLILTGNLKIWLILYLLGVAVTPFFGRVYCAYVCPMNTLMRPVQDVSRKIKFQRIKLSAWMESPVLPWVMLVLSVLSMLLGKRLLHREIPVLLILLGISAVVTFFFNSSFFHNGLCPYSILLRFAARKPRSSRTVAPSACIRCKKCIKVCPSNAITMTGPDGTALIDSSICHQCEACSAVCPSAAITYKWAGK